mgnify:FL=1
MAKKETFEQAMDRLEALVQELENGTASLDESIKLYEEGSKLAKQCEERLKNARQKITMLTAPDTGEENS